MASVILPHETIIEVVAVNKKTLLPTIKEMTIKQWQELKKDSNYNYIPYQKGCSRFNTK